MGMNIVEQHFKDEADRNRQAARNANYEIGSLRYGKEHAEKQAEHFKAQYNTAFQDLQTARNAINRLATEIEDTIGSESTIGRQVDTMADRIESGIETLLARRWSL